MARRRLRPAAVKCAPEKDLLGQSGSARCPLSAQGGAQPIKFFAYQSSDIFHASFAASGM